MSYLISPLTPSQRDRYSRQAILPSFTATQQLQLLSKSFLIIGLGGLGSPVALYLTAAGCAKIGLVDFDTVELHNLQRQILYTESDIGKSKSACAFARLSAANTTTTFVRHDIRLSHSTAHVIGEYDIIIDCTDCVSTRYLINDYSVYYGKKFVVGAVLKWDGQIYTFNGGGCYRCLYPVPRVGSATCSEAGVMGPLCGVVGAVQCTEAIKAAVGIERSQLVVYNGLTMEYKYIQLRGPRSKCTVCSGGAPIIEEVKNTKCPNKEILKYITWSDYFKNTEKYLLVDIRPETLFELSHIKGAINITRCKIKEFVPNKKVALLCNKGISVKKVALELLPRHSETYIIEGGLSAFFE